MQPSTPLSSAPQALAQRLADAYGRYAQVEAVALAGSQTTAAADAQSDIDLYVYLSAELPLSSREAVAQDARHAELNNQFWEPGDEWVDDASGIHVDVMFRHTGWIEEQLRRVLDEHQPSIGYSTAFWHNVRSSQALYDRRGWFAAQQQRAEQPYPEQLRQAIIAKNHPLLRSSLSSYRYQIAGALRRDDLVAINHRVAALLASYFDILFALNRLPHPGEKRMLAFAEQRCDSRPSHLREQITALLAATAPASGQLLQHLDALLDALDTLLDTESPAIDPAQH